MKSFTWNLSGSFAWKRLACCASQLVLPSGFRRPESFVAELSLAILRDLSLGKAWAWDFSLGNFCLISSALKGSIGSFRLGSFAWEISLDSFGLGSFVWELSLWDFRLRTFALELALRPRNLSLETFVVGNFRLGTLNWDLWSLVLDILPGIFCLGTFA